MVFCVMAQILPVEDLVHCGLSWNARYFSTYWLRSVYDPRCSLIRRRLDPQIKEKWNMHYPTRHVQMKWNQQVLLGFHCNISICYFSFNPEENLVSNLEELEELYNIWGDLAELKIIKMFLPLHFTYTKNLSNFSCVNPDRIVFFFTLAVGG